MNTACIEFRRALVAALEQRRSLAELSIGAHIATCGDCRAVLESERALDDLLERAHVQNPVGLSSRVLRSLQAERARGAPQLDGLDRLLDALPAPVAPVGLAPRVLRALARARADERERVRPSAGARALRAWKPLAAAAALVVSISLWGAWQLRSRGLSKQPPQGLLAELELLESIELLQGAEIDVLLSELPDDEVELLQASSESEDAAPQIAPPVDAPGKRSNG
ncbi:MAG: hypothetical protein EPO68_06570 [Planctomycetota bacterium]|nr:MAG: hypothetical protein EPO68_06570 [Planctomycetota bacterium]